MEHYSLDGAAPVLTSKSASTAAVGGAVIEPSVTPVILALPAVRSDGAGAGHVQPQPAPAST